MEHYWHPYTSIIHDKSKDQCAHVRQSGNYGKCQRTRQRLSKETQVHARRAMSVRQKSRPAVFPSHWLYVVMFLLMCGLSHWCHVACHVGVGCHIDVMWHVMLLTCCFSCVGCRIDVMLHVMLLSWCMSCCFSCDITNEMLQWQSFHAQANGPKLLLQTAP